MIARKIPIPEDTEAAFTGFVSAVDQHLLKYPKIELSTKEGTAVGKAYWAYLKPIPVILWNKLYTF